MIHVKLLREEGVLVVSPSAKLTPVDFEQVRALVDPYIKEHGTLQGLLIDAESFPRWEEFANLLSQFSFVQEYEARIKRVAAVTDSRFLAIVPQVAEHFVAAEIRHFEYRDRDQALDWLRNG
jgi:hypothetical protein